MRSEDSPPTVCGLSIVDMPQDVTPLAAVVVVKALDEYGDPAYYARATEGVLTVEAVGMLTYADESLRRRWRESGDA